MIAVLHSHGESCVPLDLIMEPQFESLKVFELTIEKEADVCNDNSTSGIFAYQGGDRKDLKCVVEQQAG